MFVILDADLSVLTLSAVGRPFILAEHMFMRSIPEKHGVSAPSSWATVS